MQKLAITQVFHLVEYLHERPTIALLMINQPFDPIVFIKFMVDKQRGWKNVFEARCLKGNRDRINQG